MSKAILYL